MLREGGEPLCFQTFCHDRQPMPLNCQELLFPFTYHNGQVLLNLRFQWHFLSVISKYWNTIFFVYSTQSAFLHNIIIWPHVTRTSVCRCFVRGVYEKKKCFGVSIVYCSLGTKVNRWRSNCGRCNEHPSFIQANAVYEWY